MALSIYVPDDFVVGIAEQTTYGTVIADAGAFDQLKVDKPTLEADVKDRSDLSSRGVRWQDVLDMKKDEVGSNPKLKLPEHIVRKKQLAVLLYSLFQYVVEAGTTPYGKTFTFHDTQPDFTANAGKFLTAILKAPVASKSLKLADLIALSLTLKCSPGGLLTVACDLVGRGALVTNSNPSGTWTVAAAASTTAMDFYPFEKIDRYTLDFGSPISPAVGAWELTLNHTLTPVGQSAGSCQSFAISKNGGTFKGSYIWNSDTHALFTNHPLGTACAIRIGWGNATPGTVDGDLDIAPYGVLEKVELNAADAMMVDATFKLGGSISGTKEPCTIVLADATDKTW